jgi:hypothetical protein
LARLPAHCGFAKANKPLIGMAKSATLSPQAFLSSSGFSGSA